MTGSDLPRRGAVLGVAVLVIGLFVVGGAPAGASQASPTGAGHSPLHAGHVSGGGGGAQGPSGPFLWWMPFVMPVLWLGLLAGVVYLLYRAVSGVASSGSAVGALDRAYARGEISADEYEHRRERLES